MSTNKQALRQLAEKAISEEGETWWNEEQLASDYGLALHRTDAKFIAAANPATLLALLDELEAAERRNAEREELEVNEEVSDEELNAALQLHRLKVDGHSQLSDAFRAGFKYASRTAGITVKGE